MGPRTATLTAGAVIGLAAGLGLERLGHPLDESVGHTLLAPAGDDLAQLGLESVGPDAGAAQIEVTGDLHPPLLGELAVEVEVQPFDGLVASDEPRDIRRPVTRFRCRFARYFPISHWSRSPYLALSPAPTRPLVLPRSTNAFCSAFLPRWIRLITVPMGTSVISAISL